MAGLLASCVWNPTDDAALPSATQPIAVTGFASRPNAPLQLRAWNYERGAWEPLRTFPAGTAALGRDVPIYAWSAEDPLLGAPLFGARYWSGAGRSCATPGQAWIQVREYLDGTWHALPTFDAAGRACTLDAIGAGVDLVAAGDACRTGTEVVLSAPPACATAPAVDTSPPAAVVVRATDGETGWEYKNGGIVPFGSIPVRGAIRIRADGFDPQGVADIQIDWRAVVQCRRADGTIGTASAVLRAYDQGPISTGARVPTTRGTAFDVTQAWASTFCAGATAVAVTLDGDTTAGNRAGQVATAPRFAFTVTF